jgi:hypothetical protein
MNIDKKTKALASVCKACPFCIVARRIPNSAYAKTLKKIEKNCPFCKAYARLKAFELKESD